MKPITRTAATPEATPKYEYARFPTLPRCNTAMMVCTDKNVTPIPAIMIRAGKGDNHEHWRGRHLISTIPYLEYIVVTCISKPYLRDNLKPKNAERERPTT